MPRNRIAGVIFALFLTTLSSCSVGTHPGTISPGNATPTAPATTAVATTKFKPALLTTATTVPTATSAPTGQLLSVIEVNRLARPAVVQITNNQTARTRTSASGYQIPAGVGTGFLFDSRGYILTNNHVIAGASSLTVVTADARTYPGTIVGADAQDDLAVVQITGDGDLPVLALGDSSELRVGETVVAIGNALALRGGPTVTTGVVSALGRVEQEPSSGLQPGAMLTDLIQTDAAINPGNSGGPLLNLRGQVVGINTMGATQDSSRTLVEGVNFAIAINAAKPVATALLNHQTIPRPYLGLTVAALTPLQDAQLGLAADTGVIVTSVATGSPAANAGLQVHDIIMAVDGQEVQGEEGYVGLLMAHKPGDSVTLTFLRGGKHQEVSATLTQSVTG